MRETLEKAEPPGRSYPPADFRRRALARGIDLAVAAAPLFFAGKLRSIAFVSAALVLLGDALFGDGRSLGKRLAGLRTIVLATRRPAGFRASIERNAIFVLAVVPALAGAPLVVAAAELTAILLLESFVALRPLTRDLGQRRFGDLFAGTQVIDGRVPLEAEAPKVHAVAPAAPLASRAARASQFHEGAACASP